MTYRLVTCVTVFGVTSGIPDNQHIKLQYHPTGAISVEKSILELSNCYICLLAWFITGIPTPFMKEAYRVKAEIENVLRVLTNSQLTGVELVLAVKDKYRDALSEVSTVHSPA